MSIPGWLRRSASFPLYPLLAAAYPVVFLYAHNVKEAIDPAEVLIPIAFALAVTIATVVLFRALTRDWAAAALGSLLLVVLFFSYGMTWDWIGTFLNGQWVLLTCWLLLAVNGMALIWRFKSHAWRATLPLNVLVAIAVAFNLVIIGSFVLNLRPVAAKTGSGVTASGQPTNTAARPDIYWIVLEEYGSEQVLRDDFNYDNTPFLDALRKRGFYIAADSTANYLKTAPSIMSARDLEYLDVTELRDQAKTDDDWGPIYRALRSPFEVQQFLDNLGYRFIYAGTFWQPMAQHPSAEINYVYDRLTSEFTEALQRSTMLRAIDEVNPEGPYDWRRNRWNQTLYELRSLEHASSLAGPKFIHTQLALDHEPYVFNPDGSFITDAQAKAMTHEQQYVAQLKYTNTQLLAWVDQLLAVPAKQRPIIMLLADEGPWPKGYRSNEKGFDWTTASPDVLKQKFGILNAVYLPDRTGEQAGLYSGITPVNQFRVLFNSFFGLDLPLLPDRNYIWPDQSHIYDLIDVTDKVH